MHRELLWLGVAVGLALLLSGCSGETSALQTAVTPAITLTPTATVIEVMQPQQFSASVTGVANTAVTWQITEANGGTISATGLYTAPATPGTYHVVAVSVANPTLTATCTVTVNPTPTFTLTPTATAIEAMHTQQFSASVTGVANTAVTWQITETNGGTISTTGLYTAPATPGTYHVVAVSVADPTLTATCTVTVNPTPTSVPAITLTPDATVVNVRNTLKLTAAVTGYTNTAVTWHVTETNGGSVSSPVSETNDGTITYCGLSHFPPLAPGSFAARSNRPQ